MSKKDYELIARVFRTKHAEIDLTENRGASADAHALVDDLASDMATEIRAYDGTGRFDRARFLAACSREAAKAIRS